MCEKISSFPLRFGLLCIGLILSHPLGLVGQDNGKADDDPPERPRLFKGRLIKRFENLQEKLRKDREEKREKFGKDAESMLDRLREQLGGRDAEKKSSNDETDARIPRTSRRSRDSANPGNSPTDRNPLNGRGQATVGGAAPALDGPPILNPQNRVDDSSRNNRNPQVSLGVNVARGGVGSPGLEIQNIERGLAAERAGLKKDDRIISVGGSPVRKVDDLKLIMDAFEPGDRTEIEFIRNAKRETALVEFEQVGNNPDATAQRPGPPRGRSTETLPSPQDGKLSKAQKDSKLPLIDSAAKPTLRRNGNASNERRAGLGVTALTVDPTLASRNGLSVRQGALLENIKPDSAAAQAGLKPGVVVIAVDGRRVNSAVDFSQIVQTYKPGDKAQILFYEGNRLRRTQATFDALPLSELSLQNPLDPDSIQADPNRPQSRRDPLFGGITDDFPRLRRIENMVERFVPDDPNRAAESSVDYNRIPRGNGSNRETRLQSEVQGLQNQIRSQNQQIQDLTNKLQAIEKLLKEKNK